LLRRSLEESDDAGPEEVGDKRKGAEEYNRNVFYDLDEPVEGVFYGCGV